MSDLFLLIPMLRGHFSSTTKFQFLRVTCEFLEGFLRESIELFCGQGVLRYPVIDPHKHKRCLNFVRQMDEARNRGRYVARADQELLFRRAASNLALFLACCVELQVDMKYFIVKFDGYKNNTQLLPTTDMNVADGVPVNTPQTKGILLVLPTVPLLRMGKLEFLILLY